jgi:hypothetical protein
MVRSVKNFIQGTYKVYENNNFVVGDSPQVLDINTDLGKNSSEGYITIDGPGDVLVELGDVDKVFGEQFTMKKNETINFEGLEVSKIRLTHVTDSSFRVWVIP